MMDERIFELLNKKLEELKVAYSGPLHDGSAKDFGEYQSMCGVIRGLALAQREIADFVRKIKDIEDE
jgi:hypothetical protein